MNRIVIFLDGGVITEVEGLPQGFEVYVRDYDCDTVDDEDHIRRDENGMRYWEYCV